MLGGMPRCCQQLSETHFDLSCDLKGGRATLTAGIITLLSCVVFTIDEEISGAHVHHMALDIVVVNQRLQ